MYNMYSTGIALEETYLSAGREREERKTSREIVASAVIWWVLNNSYLQQQTIFHSMRM